MTPDERLGRWLEDESKVQTAVSRGPGAGVPGLELLKTKSGQQVMEGMIDGTIPYAHFAQRLTFSAIEVAKGKAVFQGALSLTYTDHHGAIHAGWIQSIMDSAMGSAVLTTLPPGFGYVTSAVKVEFVTELRQAVDRVRAEATVLEQTPRRCSAASRLVGPDGTLYATATAECRVFEARQ